jgi:phosphoglycerate dehydrogenase-like enzyme
MTPSTTILVSNEHEDDPGAAMVAELPGARVVRYDPDGSLGPEHEGARVLIPPYRRSRRAVPLAKQLPALRLVALLSAGADRWLDEIPDGVQLADCKGAHGAAVAEWAVTAILCVYRGFPGLLAAQQRHEWAHRMVPARSVVGARALIIGAGDVGTQTAQRLQALGATTTVVARRSREGVHPVAELPNLVSGHDIVVLATPVTDHTRRMVDAKFLVAMPDGALLVNCGRGELVDTLALLTELRSQRLRAALDVTDPEPLPPEHPLWETPGVLITPHVARTVDGQSTIAYGVACRQVEALLVGRTPSNLVTSAY